MDIKLILLLIWYYIDYFWFMHNHNIRSNIGYQSRVAVFFIILHFLNLKNENNNFVLPLLCRMYHIHIFVFQIQKMKNNEKRSDARLISNVWPYIVIIHTSTRINISATESTLCPFHSGESPMFDLPDVPQTSHFYCYVCQKHIKHQSFRVKNTQ